MVENIQQVRRGHLKPTLFLAAIILLLAVLVGGPVVNLLRVSSAPSSEEVDSIWTYRILSSLVFTFVQAFLSALISVAAGVFVATALARKNFPKLLLSFLQVPFALPSVAVGFAFILTFGMSGYLNQIFSALGFSFQFKIYGPLGIILANIYFNVSFAAVSFLTAMQSIPTELTRSVRILKLSYFKILQTLILPHLKGLIKSVFINVMIFCLFNFTLSLLLSGGPAYATLEVLVFQSIHFDYQPDLAARIGLLQLALGILVFFPFRKNFAFTLKQTTKSSAHDGSFLPHSIFVTAFFWLYVLFIAAPLIALAVDGLKAALISWNKLDFEFLTLTGKSFLTSALIGLTATFASTGLALAINFQLRRTSPRSLLRTMIPILCFAILLISPVVLSLSLFLSFGYQEQIISALGLIVLLHILLRLPFSVLQIRPAVDHAFSSHEKSCEVLNLRGWKSFRLIYLPSMRNEIIRNLSLGFLFSIADLSVVSIFANDQISTIPLLIYRLMGSYRFPEASVLTLAFVICCVLIFWISTTQKPETNG